MNDRDINMMPAQRRWKDLRTPQAERALADGMRSGLKPDQLKLLEGIAGIIIGAAKDQRGTVNDDKYRAIVDLIVSRVRWNLTE